MVFLVGCAEEQVPGAAAARAARAAAPSCSSEAPAAGDAHLQEERRLFYVAMTRAKDELVLTSAADYGTSRARKVSRFVVEALDLPSPAPAAARSARARGAGAPPADAGARRRRRAGRSPTTRCCGCRSARSTTTETCPLKYRYVHVLRVPLLTHHRVVYGSAIHKAVQQLLPRAPGRPRRSARTTWSRRSARPGSPRASCRASTRRSGCAPGEEALRRFHREEAAQPLVPTGGRAGVRLLRRPHPRARPLRPGGRARRPASRSSTSRPAPWTTRRRPASARRRACSSTSTRWPTSRRAAGCRTGSSCASWSRASPPASARRSSEAQADRGGDPRGVGGIRRREFPAPPSCMACGQCAFRDICPHTARQPEGVGHDAA